ncbi:MAG: MFS transporter [Candidatus Ancillula sp.]|jgi:MFS family permease|nr:MFS transporter [Candidatus Ancillula sp.]
MVDVNLNVGVFPRDITCAVRACYVLFACFGMVYITFLSRIVHIRQLLGNITADQASVILLALALGSTVSTPIGGAILERVSVIKIIRIFAAFCAILLFLEGVFASSVQYWTCVVLAIFFGLSNGLFNIANNIAGVIIEKRSNGKTLMPRFHSFFQIGAVSATSISQITVRLGIDIRFQFAFVALVVIVAALISSCYIFDRENVEKRLNHEEVIQAEIGAIDDSAVKLTLLQKLNGKGLDLSVLLIGLIVCVTTLTEGSGNDWIASGIVEGFDETEVAGLLGMWIYLAVTATTRFFGNNLLDRFGRVASMRACFICAIAGVLIYTLSPFEWCVYLACIFWGFGVALGYPVGVSAASESKTHSAFRVSVAAGLGTIMNIAGPPIIGILASAVTIRLSLLVLLPGLILGFFVIPVLKNTSSRNT